MKNRLEDRIIFITGGASGIGRAAALQAAAEGAVVVIGDLDVATGQKTLEELKNLSAKSLFIALDVTKEESIKSAIDQVMTEFGQLDGAFNNAGLEMAGKPLWEVTSDEWNRAVAVNQTGVFLCMKYEMQAMLKQGKGSIVNTSSALSDVTFLGCSDYTSTKAGVVGLTKAAAVDAGELGIRVNAIRPGSAVTPMLRRAVGDPDAELSEGAQANINRHAMKRWAEPSEIAAAAIWLLSDEASFITGTAVPVDGGYTAN